MLQKQIPVKILRMEQSPSMLTTSGRLQSSTLINPETRIFNAGQLHFVRKPLPIFEVTGSVREHVQLECIAPLNTPAKPE